MLIEGGKEIRGEWRKVNSSSPMLEGQFYEFHFDLWGLPIPLPGINWLREKVIRAFLTLKSRFEGIQIIYWRVNEDAFIFQAKGESESPVWKSIALTVVATACSGILLVAGVYIVFRFVQELIKQLPSFVGKWGKWLGGGIFVVGLVVLGLVLRKIKGEKKRQYESLGSS